jgi:hypothetical protein
MLVLLDENLPHRLRTLITGHDVPTVAYQNWNALTNGALLEAAEDAGFDVMITADKNIQYQQNIDSRKMALVVLSNNERDVVMLNAGKIVAAINNAKPGSFVAVEIF